MTDSRQAGMTDSRQAGMAMNTKVILVSAVSRVTENAELQVPDKPEGPVMLELMKKY
jgi:hypothetical protein